MKIENMNQLKRMNNTRIRKIEQSYYLISNGECFELNEIGALVVNAIGKDLSFGKVCMRLSDIYSYKNIEIIERDVSNYIDYLIENDIVTILSEEIESSDYEKV